MATLKIPRGKGLAGALAISYSSPTCKWGLLGIWKVSDKGVVDESKTRLHYSIRDHIELEMALGKINGVLKDGAKRWQWRLTKYK